MIYEGYDWDDRILENFCPIFCAGFEDRCLGFLASLPENWQSENAILLKYPGTVFPQNDVNSHYISELLKRHVENIYEIQITSSFSRNSIKHLFSILQNLNEENIIMDISSMTRGNILSFLNLLSSVTNNSYLTYTEPIYYNDLKTYGLLDLVIVPGFEGNVSLEKKNSCIYLLGFNVDYVKYIQNKYEVSDDLESFLVGKITDHPKSIRNEWNEIALKNCKDFGITPIQIPSLDVHHITKLILQIFSQRGNEYNKIIFPLGPKTYTIAAFLSHRKNPGIQICYPKPAGWSDTSSCGIGMTYFYYL